MAQDGIGKQDKDELELEMVTPKERELLAMYRELNLLRRDIITGAIEAVLKDQHEMEAEQGINTNT